MADSTYWDRVRQPFSRRRTLQASATGGAAPLLVASGCSSSKGSSSGSNPAASSSGAGGTPTPRNGGTIRLGTSAGVGKLIDLDPHVDTPVYAIHMRLIYQGLLGYDVNTYAVKPLLAQKWEQ